MSRMRHLLDMTPEDLEAELARLGQKAYRASQIAQWVWQRGVYDFAAMTNLPAALRDELAGELIILTGRVVAEATADDGTVKLLIQWPDGERIETVLIPTPDRATACVSTQVGCALRCGFCASGLEGLRRDLSGGEIVEQVLHLQRVTARHVTHVVFMGMGEPLANYGSTVFALRAIVDPRRLGISARKVTVSTVGLPDAVRRLAREDLPVTLAISLHAPNDAIRRQIMPAAAQHKLADVLAAAEEFFASRNRRLTLEYVLLAGVNDTNVCAEMLARIARRLEANVNLIRYNPVEGLGAPTAKNGGRGPLPFERPTESATRHFAARLERLGANVQIRQSRGLQADAACGQLRRRAEHDQS